ncbi:SCP-like protein, partial [Ancylostoma duodenale]
IEAKSNHVPTGQFKMLHFRDLKTGDLIYKAGKKCADGGSCTTYPSSTCDSSLSLCVRGNVPAAATTTPSTTAAPVQAETMSTTTGLAVGSDFYRTGLAVGEATTTNNERMLRSSNMMRLRWNCGMEAAALQHAMACTFAKSELSTRPDYGENQATITVASNYQAAAEEAVRQWWKTSRTIGGVGRDRIYQRSFFGTPIDGFTQMAWATTTKLGCAIVKCSGRYNVVCRYNPRGNIVGEEIYRRGRPCSQCPLGTTCLDNLCRFN